MVIGLLAIVSIPTVIGVGQAVSAQKKQNATQKESAKFNLTADRYVNGNVIEESFVVLVDGKLYVDDTECPVRGHRFDGYYFTYPGEEGHRGVVSTISEDPPMLNWIYVDSATRAVRFGSRKDSLGHVIGPWGWSADESHLVLRGSEQGFILVREKKVEEEGEMECSKPGSSEPRGAPSSSTPPTQNQGRDASLGGHRWAVYWDPDGELRKRKKARDWRPVLLRRRMKLGMESRYVKANE